MKERTFRLYAWIWYLSEFWLPPEKRRPWTFMMRDFYHDSPLLCIFFISNAGYVLGRFILKLSLTEYFLWSSGILLGLILGHLWWGNPYVPGEQEEPEFNPLAGEGPGVFIRRKYRGIP